MPTPARLRHVIFSARRISTVRSTPPPVVYQRLSRPNEPSSPSGTNGTPSPSPWQALPWTLAALTAGAIGLYTVQIYLAANKPCLDPTISHITNQKDVATRYDAIADKFDSDVEFSELLMGMHGLRRRLAQKCAGHVLEVSCGTGRNLGYYRVLADPTQNMVAKVDSLTLIDLSPAMVEVCRRKWDTVMSGGKKKHLKPELRVRFLTGSALRAMPLAPSGRKYDCIIQTMGLCSTSAPDALLANIVQHLNTSSPDSRILLLEHGRSYLPWLNNILDNSAEKHAELHGCWFNRDIGGLVEDAAQKHGLEVIYERRHHFGTTWIFELKPGDGLVKASRD